MPDDISMPKLSDTMEEGTLLKWYKKEGDYLREGEPLFEVETDKAVLEVESPLTGVLSRILVREGETVPVGTTIAVMGIEEGKVIPENEPMVEVPRQQTEELHTDHQREKAAPRLTVVPAKDSGKPPSGIEARAHASPAARSYAKQRGIDLSQVGGTGKGGMITLRDVRNVREESVVENGAVPLPQRSAPPSGKFSGLSKMRKAIAATVSYSKQHIPHFYISYEVDMGNILSQLDAINQPKESRNRITVNDVIIRAVATTLKDYPYLNAIFPEGELILKKEVNMGIVIGLPEGLIIPVLKNCSGLTLDEISSGVKRLREKATAGKFSPDDFTDGSFTISNLGMLGVSDFAAIIYPPQTAILAVSAIRETPVIKGGAVVSAKIMKVTLSMDHRVVDGINAASFLRAVKENMETETIASGEKPCCTVDDD